jgi:hypothetical protein
VLLRRVADHWAHQGRAPGVGTPDARRTTGLEKPPSKGPTLAALQNLAPTVVIRAARGSDGPALRRLAALDSADVPAGELLIAEADDALVAAVSVDTGAKVADPFRRTADVVDLLAFRAKRLRAA